MGLGGSVWNKDLARGERLASRLESGSAWVNTHFELDCCLFPHLTLESNIRLPLPKGLVPPDRNPEWVVLIGQLYGTQHPVIMFKDYPWLTDGEMDQLLGYELAHLGGGDLPYPDIPEDPDEDVATL